MRRLLFLAVLFVGCTESNDKATTEWIEQAEKPIVCRSYRVNGATLDKEYTLIDATGRVYATGWVSLDLPDTLKGDK
jgi:hypothetical protein